VAEMHRKDVIINPLAMTVGTVGTAGMITQRTKELQRRTLGVNINHDWQYSSRRPATCM